MKSSRSTYGGCNVNVGFRIYRKNGSFFRKSDSKTIRRWRCAGCGKSISQATGTHCLNQNKRRVNEPLRKLLCSGVSQRRAAFILNINKMIFYLYFYKDFYIMSYKICYKWKIKTKNNIYVTKIWNIYNNIKIVIIKKIPLVDTYFWSIKYT